MTVEHQPGAANGPDTSVRKRRFDEVETPQTQSHQQNGQSNQQHQQNRPYQNRRPFNNHFGKSRHMPEEQMVQLYHPLRLPPGQLPSAYPDFLSLVHNEIMEYTASVQMDEEEIRMKREIIDKLNKLVKSLWGNDACVKPFGSFVTGFSLPHSDLDLVVQLPNVASEHAADELSNLRTALSSLPFKVQPVYFLLGHARVPILKYTDNDHSVKMDLCVNQADGLNTIPLMQAYSDEFPSLKPLLLTIKLMLARLNLHEVFTGGVNSFIMQLMIIAFLQLHRAVESTTAQQSTHPNSDNLGMLLYSLLDYYAHKFDYINYGMVLAPPRSMLKPGQSDQPSFYLKSDKNRFDHSKPYLLSIENPLHPERDSCASSFGMLRIRRSLAIAHELMTVLSGEWALNGGIDRVTGSTVPNIKIPLPFDVRAERQSDAAAEGDDETDNESDSDDDMTNEGDTETLPTLTPLERKKIADEKRIVLGPVLQALTTRRLYVTPQLIEMLESKQAEWKNKKKQAREYRKMIRAKNAGTSASVVAEEPQKKSKSKKKKKTKVSKIEKLRRKLARERDETDLAEGVSSTAAAGTPNDEDAASEVTKESKTDKRARRKRRQLEREEVVQENGDAGIAASEEITESVKPKKHKKRKVTDADVVDASNQDTPVQ